MKFNIIMNYEYAIMRRNSLAINTSSCNDNDIVENP